MAPAEPSDQDNRMKAFYDDCKDRFGGMDVDALSGIFLNLKNQTKCLLFAHSDHKIAMHLALAQRRSLDPEPVDVCRAQICFNPSAYQPSVDSERLKKRWDKMCKEIGQCTVKDACMLLAKMGYLIHHEKLLSSKKEEQKLLDVFEKHAEEEILADRIRGSECLLDWVESAATTLHMLHTQNQELLSDMFDEHKAKVAPTLHFLRTVKPVTRAEGIELAVLASLLLLKDSPAELMSQLQSLESIALWMLTAKPNPVERQKKICVMLNHLQSSLVSDIDAEGDNAEEEVSQDETIGLRLQTKRPI